MATIAGNPRVIEALDAGCTYDDIRNFAVQQHQKMIENGATREEADADMYQTWGLRSHLSRNDADKAEWIASLLFENPQEEQEQASPKSPEKVDIDNLEIDSPEDVLPSTEVINLYDDKRREQEALKMQNGGVQRRPETRKQPGSQQVTSPFEAMIAGWQHGGLGLYMQGGLPTFKAPQDGVISQALFAVGQALSDAPAYVVGGAVGSLSGGVVGSAIPGVGTLAGATAGGMSMAMGTAAYVRSALMQAYEKGEAVSFSDLAARWANSSLAFAQDAELGLELATVNMGLTSATKAFMTRAIAKEMAKSTAKSTALDIGTAATQFAGELGTMVAHESLVERKLPTAKDVTSAAIGLMSAKYFSGGMELAKTAYVKYNIHPLDLSIIRKTAPEIFQRLLQDATRASIRAPKSVFAIETEGQAKYSERDKGANLSQSNEFPWLFVSEKQAEETLVRQMGEDIAASHRDPNSPAVAVANEAKAAYEKQVKVNERKGSKYQKAKAAYAEAQAELEAFDARGRRDDEIHAELVEKGLIDKHTPMTDTGALYEQSVYGMVNKMKGPWAAQVRAIIKKYQGAAQDDPFIQADRSQLKAKIAEAKEAFDIEQRKVDTLKDAWDRAENRIPRVTSDTPYRVLREINIPPRGATIQLNGLGDKALNYIVNRFLNSPEGIKRPESKLFNKKGMTKAQLDQLCYDIVTKPSYDFIKFLSEAKWSIDELKLIGGKENKAALSKAKPGEIVRAFGKEFTLPKDPSEMLTVNWHGIYMDNGYLPINARNVHSGELSSAKTLPDMPKAMKDVHDLINKNGKSGLRTWWDNVRNKFKRAEFEFVDRFSFLNRGHKWDGNVTPSYLAATEVAPSSGKAERFIEEGMRDWKNNDLLPNRKSLGAVLNDPKINLDVLDTILLADSGLNAVQTGTPTFISKENSLAIMTEIRKNPAWAHYKEAVQALRQVHADIIDYMRDAGLISKSKAEELHGLRDTLTVERVVSSIGEANASRTALEDIADALGVKHDAKLSPSEALKQWREKNKGAYKSPTQELVNSLMLAVRSAHVNEAKRAIASDWGVQPKYFSDDKQTAFAERSSTPLHRIEYKEHGNTKTAWIDPETYLSVSQLDTSSRAISSVLCKWILDKPASLLRWGTTHSPSFALKNTFIDQFTLGLQTRTEALPMRELGSTLAEIVMGKGGKGSELFNQWLADGGMSGSFSKYGRNELVSLIDSMKERSWQNTILKPDQKVLSQLASWVNPFPRMARLLKGGDKILGNISESGEMLPRFREYVRALEKGYSRKEAAYMSRTATLDFARAGASIRGLNQIAAFLNAGIQGFDRTIRTIKMNPEAFAAKFVNQLVIPTLWLSMAEASMMISAPDSEGANKARERPDWMRAAFWPVYFGDDYEFCVNIPKPHGVIQLMLLPFESWIHDTAKNGKMRDPFTAMAENGLTEALKNAFPNPMDFQATGLKLGAEVITNHQFFTDNAIISSKYEKLMPSQRYKESTSGVAHLAGRVLQTLSDDAHLPIPQALQSPLVIDHVIRGLGGQLCSQLAQVLGETLPIDKPSVQRDWTRNPFVKQFFFQFPNYNAKTFTEFNKVSQELEQRYHTYRRLAASPHATDRDLARKLRLEGPIVNLNKFKTAMGAQGKLIDMTYRTDRYDNETKARLIDRYMTNQVRIARQGLQLARKLQDQFDMAKKRK